VEAFCTCINNLEAPYWDLGCCGAIYKQDLAEVFSRKLQGPLTDDLKAAYMTF
jgi:hypothetical protein